MTSTSQYRELYNQPMTMAFKPISWGLLMKLLTIINPQQIIHKSLSHSTIIIYRTMNSKLSLICIRTWKNSRIQSNSAFPTRGQSPINIRSLVLKIGAFFLKCGFLFITWEQSSHVTSKLGKIPTYLIRHLKLGTFPVCLIGHQNWEQSPHVSYDI